MNKITSKEDGGILPLNMILVTISLVDMFSKYFNKIAS